MTEAPTPDPTSSRLSVRGDARLTVPPDWAFLSCRLEVNEASKAESLSAAATVLQSLVSDLRALGGVPLTVATQRSFLTWSARSTTTWPEWSYDPATEVRALTGRVSAAVSLSVDVRDFDLLERIEGALATHEEVRVTSVGWGVDDDNPGWAEVRAAAIRDAIRVGRDYAAALGGSLEALEHLADSGLLGGDGGTSSHRSGRDGWYAQSAGADEDVRVPALDPVPQELTATIEARFVITVAPIADL